jgi:dolichol-phosphate hexosyltransferase
MEVKIDKPMPVLNEALTQTELQAMRDQITVVIPTLNEEECIKLVLDEIKSKGYDKVLVVDGYSKDTTAEVVKESGVQVIMQHGSGKAGALATAFRLIETPYIVVMDGDGTYDPGDIDKFLPLMGDYIFVQGTRERNGSMTRLHKIGNAIITKAFNLLFGTSFPDICSGMYMLKTSEVKNMHFEKHPTIAEQEIAAQIVLLSKRVTSVPIHYRKRLGGKSKMRTWRQGFRALMQNFALAKSYNPVLLFSFITALALIPAFAILGYAGYLFFVRNEFRSGYVIFSAILIVIGGQGLSVATISAYLRRIERRITTRFG